MGWQQVDMQSAACSWVKLQHQGRGSCSPHGHPITASHQGWWLRPQQGCKDWHTQVSSLTGE